MSRELIPYHVAIIMDGNGRWAQERGLPRHEGHRAGTENLRRIIRACPRFGVRILTVYAFSTENWRRPPAEVAFLMRILETVIDREMADLHANEVQVRHIGHLEGLQPHLQKKVRQAIDLTRYNDRMILNVAFNYGGRDELLYAMQRAVKAGIPPEEIDETLLSYYLFTGGLPDPDLIIRTSGEIRVSNFLIWQGAYAEYFITPTYWPAFDEQEFQKALVTYGQRERRFGGVKPAKE